jgi:hypothetical protein
VDSRFRGNDVPKMTFESGARNLALILRSQCAVKQSEIPRSARNDTSP